MPDTARGPTGQALPGGHFNELPYDSYPFADTQPANLAAIATLYGLTPPAVATARVLELGCASGGNIIPLAARFPAARFTGLDLSPRHVELAAARIATLGLDNIDVRQGDLAEPGMIEGDYDYILCHGVFSWVSPAAQDAILRICSDNLAPQGIAYVSYNVLPGWQLRRIVRDIFQFDDDAGRSIPDRVARGRWLLEQLAKGSNRKSPYGQLLRQETAQLSAQSDSYIMGEFLVDENSPCYFHEFAARARAAGLEFLSETNLPSSIPEHVNPHLDHLLRAMSGPDVLMFEQYFDFLQGRQFRQTLFVKAANTASIQRKPDRRRLANLHFSSRLRLDATAGNGRDMTLKDPNGVKITTNDPAVAKAFDFLGRSWPDTCSLRDLIGVLDTVDGLARNDLMTRLLDALLRIVLTGLGSISAVPLKLGRADDDRPEVWTVARAEHRDGQPWITTLRHHPVRLDTLGGVLLSLVDGTRDAAALARQVTALMAAEDFEPDGTEPVGPGTGMIARVRLALNQMQDLALLAPKVE